MKRISAFIIFFLSGIFITFPWAFHMTSYVTGYGDNFVYAWIHTWVINSLISGNIANIFHTNIFYPYQIGPGASDPNITSAVFALIPYLVTKEPIVTVNFITIFSIILFGYSIFELSHYITRDFLASVFAGILVIFSPAYLSFYAHIQMLFVFLTPLSIMYFLIFLKSRQSKHLVFSLIFFLLQVYNAFIAGYFILFSYIVIFFFTWLVEKKAVFKLINKQNVAIFVISLLLVVPIMLPYFKVSKEFNYVRSIKDTVHFALQPEDLLYPSDFTRLNSYLSSLPINKHSENNEFKPGYLGFVFTILTIFTFAYSLTRLRKKNIYLNSFLGISLLGLVLSLGPVLHLGRHTIHPIIPLPYAVFYYLVPGFQGIRNTARWEILFITGAAIVIGIVLNKILKKDSFNKRAIVYGLLILGCIIELNFPMHFVSIPRVSQFPKEYAWLSETPINTKYIEMPIYNWNMTNYATIELWRMYYSTINFRRTVNGSGGFTPPPWQKMVYDLDSTFPQQQALNRLKSLGLNYLIIHKDEYDKLNKDKFSPEDKLVPNGNYVVKSLNRNKNLKLVKQFRNTYIYQIN